MEELIPIAHYVQVHYSEIRRIKVCWCSGSQPYDAKLSCSGHLVKGGFEPRDHIIEVTSSLPQNEHYQRRLLEEQGRHYGGKGISRNKSGQIVSKPCVYIGPERITDLVAQITERIKSKGKKPYEKGTVLIVNCVAEHYLPISMERCGRTS
jgi:hypothetical protein